MEESIVGNETGLVGGALFHLVHESGGFVHVLGLDVGLHEDGVDDGGGVLQTVDQEFGLVDALHFDELVEDFAVLGGQLALEVLVFGLDGHVVHGGVQVFGGLLHLGHFALLEQGLNQHEAQDQQAARQDLQLAA